MSVEGQPLMVAAGRAARNIWRLRLWLLSVWAVAGLLWLAGVPPLGLVLAIIAATGMIAALRDPEDGRPAMPAVDVGVDRAAPVSLAELADALPDPAVLFLADGSVLHANPAAIAAFGAFVPGMPVMLKFRAPEMHALIEAVLAGKDAPTAIDYVEKLPVERLHRVHAVAIGAGRLYALAFRDLSEMRRIDRMRADFIANASHELRTPLASIAGFIETLRGPARDDPKARDQFLDIMHAQATRMARLIDDLLSLSRLEMRSAIAPGDRADVVHVIDTVLNQLLHQAREAGVEFVRDIPASEIEVNGGHDELVQVFENLVENAVKYGGSGGRVVVCVRETTAPDEAVIVTVRDFGPGIAAEHIPRVTERFYRVEEGSRNTKGTGLGLAIVKHILTRHNARLSITSEPGQGASFMVTFPRPAP